MYFLLRYLISCYIILRIDENFPHESIALSVVLSKSMHYEYFIFIDIPVIAISSLNRENYTNVISLKAFKESGAIEYSSDVLIGLQFKKTGDDEGTTDENINQLKREEIRKIELKILKNRNGQTGDSIAYDYYPKFNCFHETGKLNRETKINSQRKRV